MSTPLSLRAKRWEAVSNAVMTLIAGVLTLIDVEDSKPGTTKREANYIIGDRTYIHVGDKQ